MHNLTSRRSLVGQSVVGQSVTFAVLLTAMSGLQSANAHEYTTLLDAKKYAEVETAVAAKLAIEPTNADALLGNIDLILLEGNIQRFDNAVKMAEQCIQHNPNSSECHESLGNVLGSKAEKGDMMDAVGSLDTIRDSFNKAIALDPANYNAAVSLMSFYLEVPGLMGGSTSSAKKLIRTTHQTNPEVAKLLQAKFDLYDENFEDARAGALAAKVDNAPVIAKLQRDILVTIGLTLLREKELSDAEKTFLEVIQRFPDSETAYFGIGRTLLEQGKPKEALVHLEQSLSLKPTAVAWYRLGKTWQALGDNTKAVTSYEQALAFSPALSSKARGDAEEQLNALKKTDFGTK